MVLKSKWPPLELPYLYLLEHNPDRKHTCISSKAKSKPVLCRTSLSGIYVPGTRSAVNKTNKKQVAGVFFCGGGAGMRIKFIAGKISVGKVTLTFRVRSIKSIYDRACLFQYTHVDKEQKAPSMPDCERSHHRKGHTTNCKHRCFIHQVANAVAIGYCN